MAILVVLRVAVPAGLAQHGVGDVVLAGLVRLNNGGHHILRNVSIVGKQLLGVLRQTVAAVAEGRVVVVGADAWVKTYSLYDGLAVEALNLGVGIKLVVAEASFNT